MTNHEQKEGEEHTIGHHEFNKAESELKIKNSKSFYELLSTLEELESITGSDGVTKYDFDTLISRMAMMFEQTDKNEKVEHNLLTSNLGLRETFKRLLAENSGPRPKLVVDQFILASGNNLIPIKGFPIYTSDWFKKDDGEILTSCTVIGSKDLSRDKYQHYYGKNPRQGYLKTILHSVKQAEDRDKIQIGTQINFGGGNEFNVDDHNRANHEKYDKNPINNYFKGNFQQLWHLHNLLGPEYGMWTQVGRGGLDEEEKKQKENLEAIDKQCRLMGIKTPETFEEGEKLFDKIGSKFFGNEAENNLYGQLITNDLYKPGVNISVQSGNNLEPGWKIDKFDGDGHVEVSKSNIKRKIITIAELVRWNVKELK